MYFRSNEEEPGQVDFTPMCPYFKQLYRIFPPSQYPSGPGGFPGYVPPFIGQPGQWPGFGPPFEGPPFLQDDDIEGDFGPPAGPPPSNIPVKAQAGVGTLAVDPGSLRRCRFRYVYIWLDNGRSFWVWLTFVGSRSISGWRWTGRRWVYFGIDTRRIDSFACY